MNSIEVNQNNRLIYEDTIEADQRTKLIYGNNIEAVKKSRIIIFGLGGVGSIAAEAISRNFIDTLVLVDFDKYEITNLNRQLYSNYETIGRAKTEVIKENIQKHCPDTHIKTYMKKVTKDNIEEFFPIKYDYVIDAIDDVKAKIELIKYCKANDIKIISSLGTGNRIKPQLLTIDSISNTSNCPLAKKLRKELKKIQIYNLDVVYSKEKPIPTIEKKLGSSSFVPAGAGLLIASYVINNLAFNN